MTIAIGSDHAGYELKARVIEFLEGLGHQAKNFGTDGPDSVDYPDFAHDVCKEVEDGHAEMAILICGSANGMAITANKHAGIRCGLCWQPEIAALTRQHNNANAIALPARFISSDLAIEIVEAYLNSSFEGGRHQRRVDKIAC